MGLGVRGAGGVIEVGASERNPGFMTSAPGAARNEGRGSAWPGSRIADAAALAGAYDTKRYNPEPRSGVGLARRIP